jgi:hypothetical protein
MVVRELLVKLGIKTDAAAIDRLNGKLNNLKTQLSSLHLGFLGLSAAALPAGLFALAKSVSSIGDAVADNAQRMGLARDSYQELAHAANLSGASIGDVGRGIKALAKTDFAKGFKSTDAALESLADKFAAMPDGMKKTALAQKMLGRAGITLIPMLNEGAAGIRAMRQEARDLGLVLSDQVIEDARSFDDALVRVTAAGTGLKNILGAALMPVFTDLMESTVDWLRANQKLIRSRLEAWAKELASGLRSVVRWVREIVNSPIVQRLGGVEGVVRKLVVGFAAIKALQIGAALLDASQALLGVVASAASAGGGLAKLGTMWAAAAPMVAAALLMAIALALQDIYVYSQGGESAIGKFMDQFEGQDSRLGAFAKGLRGLTDTINELTGKEQVVRIHMEADYGKRDTFQWFFDKLDTLQGKIYDVEIWLTAALRRIFSTFRQQLDPIFWALSKLNGDESQARSVARIPRTATDIGYGLAKSAIFSVGETARGLAGGFGAWGSGRMVSGEQFGSDAAARARLMAGFVDRPGTGATQTVNVGDINVNVAGTNASAQDIGAAVRKEMHESYMATRLNYKAGAR